MKNLNDYGEIRECLFKEERYSVRDNGAILRHAKTGSRARKLDEQWTFGTLNEKDGHLYFAGKKVYQIVVQAFLEPAERPNLLIGHIDGDKTNNSANNLRWITRFENALNSPSIRRQVEELCGSVEKFLKHPWKFRENFTGTGLDWLGTVSQETANQCFENLSRWEREDEENYDKIGKKSYKELEKEWQSKPGYQLKTSLTPNAYQMHLQTRCFFPCCPQEISEHPLQDYYDNLEVGKRFSKTTFDESCTYYAAFDQQHHSVVVVNRILEKFKPYALTVITFEDGHFIHDARGIFFQKEEALEKLFQLTGEECEDVNFLVYQLDDLFNKYSKEHRECKLRFYRP